MIINEQISSSLSGKPEIWLDWIEENYNFSYDDLEYTRIVLENNYCGQEGRYCSCYVAYLPSNGNGSKYGYGNTLENVAGNGYFYITFNRDINFIKSYGSGYDLFTSIVKGNGDFYSAGERNFAYGNGVNYIKDE